MYNLLASAAFFVLLHRAISGSSARGVLVRAIGELAYGRLFQIASIAGLVWLAVAYAGASQPAVVGQLWSASSLVRHLQLIIQPLALLLIVTGFTTPNPGTFRQEAVADQSDIVHGLLRVTRHPFLWGMALFAGGHVLAMPSPRNLVLFGTLLAVALTGTVSIDAKRRRSLGPKWTAFASRTSNIPFAAILAGRQPLRLDELGWKNVTAAAALSAALVLTHSFLFGVPARPEFAARERCTLMNWLDVALGAAGVIGIGVAVAHGIIVQRRMVRPLDNLTVTMSASSRGSWQASFNSARSTGSSADWP